MQANDKTDVQKQAESGQKSEQGMMRRGVGLGTGKASHGHGGVEPLGGRAHSRRDYPAVAPSVVMMKGNSIATYTVHEPAMAFLGDLHEREGSASRARLAPALTPASLVCWAETRGGAVRKQDEGLGWGLAKPAADVAESSRSPILQAAEACGRLRRRKPNPLMRQLEPVVRSQRPPSTKQPDDLGVDALGQEERGTADPERVPKSRPKPELRELTIDELQRCQPQRCGFG
ncbi:hypothetical protein L227DRAFT_598988 [Lentinus tigrinus ALCF2SS1-6]|uniref:Uncharacterized protein n=1 Tax=Lentinus tigrinus ALCF2SS1-6 TaxID=1328759 RepID=A0A5C2SHG7_9APHY|nr:hypothetical protein L227DRAFT_598988 [Lentinus tigrinus ALCF2SS1-6]